MSLTESDAYKLLKQRDDWMNRYDQIKTDRDRLRHILNAIAKGIHTDRVDAQIAMSMEDQKLDLLDVLEREMKR